MVTSLLHCRRNRANPPRHKLEYNGGCLFLINTYSMKQPDLYYFEVIKWRHKPSQILYGEYDPQASPPQRLVQLEARSVQARHARWRSEGETSVAPFLSRPACVRWRPGSGPSTFLLRRKPLRRRVSVLCELCRHFYGFKIVWIRLFHGISVL